MNRNEAKIWAKLSREELKEIGKIEYEKHYDFICAFGSGAEIESKHIEGTKWVEDNYPEFRGYMEYRVKPSAEKPAEPWNPKNGEYYFFLSYDGEVIQSHWNGSRCDIRSFEMGNCFRTRSDAEAARERVRAALKGETVSKTETVENKSHIAELYKKLGEPSIAVFHCDGTDRERGAAVELDGDKKRVLEGLSFLFISLYRRGFKPDDLDKVLGIAIKHFYEHGKKIKVEKIEV